MMPLERLEAEITELAGHLAAAECRWLLLDRRVRPPSRLRGVGLPHVRALVELAMRPRPARGAQERVRVARALEELPLITAEFASAS